MSMSTGTTQSDVTSLGCEDAHDPAASFELSVPVARAGSSMHDPAAWEVLGVRASSLGLVPPSRGRRENGTQRRGHRQKMITALDKAAALSRELASEATKRARREKDIDSHRAAVHAHCRANDRLDEGAPCRASTTAQSPWERKTYDKYVRHIRPVFVITGRSAGISGTRRGHSRSRKVHRALGRRDSRCCVRS